MRPLLVLALLVLIAGAAHAQVPRLVSSTGGSGAPPEASDRITYRYVQWPTFGRRDEAVDSQERTARLSELEVSQLELAHLPQMRPGERRLLRYFGNSSIDCDHFGCAPKRSWDIELELVSVTPYHDELPEGMHIVTRPLRVRRGAVQAVLPSDSVEALFEIRHRGDEVVLDALVTPFPEWKRGVELRFTLTQLHARLADAEAADALRRGRWAEAMTRADLALSLDPSLDTAHLARAWSLLGRGRLEDAAAALAPLVARNPVWLYWKLASTPALARLLAHPSIRRLAAAAPGTFVADYHAWSVQTEPTGRWLAYYSDGGTVDGMQAYCGVINVVDRATVAVAVRMPTGCDPQYAKGEPDVSQRRAAERTLRDLGFTAATGETPDLAFTDPYEQWFPHQTAEFPQARLKLVAKGAAGDHDHLPVDLPQRARIVDALLVGDVVVYRWRYPGMGVGVAHRAPASARPVPPAPAPAPTPPAKPAPAAVHPAVSPPPPVRSSTSWPLIALPLLTAAAVWLLVRRSGATGV